MDLAPRGGMLVWPTFFSFSLSLSLKRWYVKLFRLLTNRLPAFLPSIRHTIKLGWHVSSLASNSLLSVNHSNMQVLRACLLPWDNKCLRMKRGKNLLMENKNSKNSEPCIATKQIINIALTYRSFARSVGITLFFGLLFYFFAEFFIWEICFFKRLCLFVCFYCQRLRLRTEKTSGVLLKEPSNSVNLNRHRDTCVSSLNYNPICSTKTNFFFLSTLLIDMFSQNEPASHQIGSETAFNCGQLVLDDWL